MLTLILLDDIVNFSAAFNNHVVQYNAAIHDLGDIVKAPHLAWLTKNLKALLKDPKSALDILPYRFLTGSKVGAGRILWIPDGFD